MAAPPSAATGRAPAGETFERIPQVVSHVSPSIVTLFVQTSEGQAEGSGVIWEPSGTIVTNDHVVEGAECVQVAFASGAKVSARVKATDPLYDLAVVTVDRKNLPAATFATRLPPRRRARDRHGQPARLRQHVAYIPPQAQAVSIGFAIPAPTVADDVRQLIAKGKAVHAFLGIHPAEVTPRSRSASTWE